MKALPLAAALGLALLPITAQAKTVTANCTGMFNLDTYKFDTEQPEQEVAGIGKGAFTMDEQAIVMVGSFGEWRFELKGGKLYQDGKDSGLHCTYSGLK